MKMCAREVEREGDGAETDGIPGVTHHENAIYLVVCSNNSN